MAMPTSTVSIRATSLLASPMPYTVPWFGPRAPSKPRALGEVHAGLAAAQLPVIGDVVVDERTRLEVLDGRRGAAGALKAAAHCGGGEHADERAVAFAGIGGKRRKRSVQIALDIGGGRLSVKERGQIVVDLVKVLG